MYPLPIVKVTYQGTELSKREFDSRPELHALYPSAEVFMSSLYLPLLKKAEETGLLQKLHISEHEIRVNGELLELMK
jgi:hypothetical protein